MARKPPRTQNPRPPLPTEIARWDVYFDPPDDSGKRGAHMSLGDRFGSIELARHYGRQTLLMHSMDVGKGKAGYYTLTNGKGVIIERMRMVPRGTPGAIDGRWVDERHLIDAPAVKTVGPQFKMKVTPLEVDGRGFRIDAELDGVHVGHLEAKWIRRTPIGPVLKPLIRQLSHGTGMEFVHVMAITDAMLLPEHVDRGPAIYFRALREAKSYGFPLASGPEPTGGADASADASWQSKLIQSYTSIVGTEGYFLGWPRTA